MSVYRFVFDYRCVILVLLCVLFRNMIASLHAREYLFLFVFAEPYIKMWICMYVYTCTSNDTELLWYPLILNRCVWGGGGWRPCPEIYSPR